MLLFHPQWQRERTDKTVAMVIIPPRRLGQGRRIEDDHWNYSCRRCR